MPSSIDICNRALSECGARSTINAFDEGSAEAIQCSLWYDVLRKSLLRVAPWGFAREQVDLSLLGSGEAGTSIYPWPFMYAHPPNALRVRYLLPPSPPADQQPLPFAYGLMGPSRANRFIIAQARNALDQPIKVVLGTLRDAQAVIVTDTTDVSLFDPLFDLALTALLSYKMVIPLTGNAGMRDQFRASVQDAITSARVADGNEAIPTTDHTPDWISARGDGFAYPNAGMNLLGNWYIGWDDLSWGE